MGSSNSNTANVPDETSTLSKAWLAELHKDFEAKVKAAEQHEQMQEAAKSKQQRKKRKPAQPVIPRNNELKPLTVPSATSADTGATSRPVANAPKRKQKHKSKPTKHNELGHEDNSLPAVYRDTPVTGGSALAAIEKHQVTPKGNLTQSPSGAPRPTTPENAQCPEVFLHELLRRKNDEQQTIQSEDEHWALRHNRQRRLKKLSNNALQEKPTPVISSAPVNSIAMTLAPLFDVAKAQDAFTVSDSVPAASGTEQTLTEHPKASMPEHSPTITSEPSNVTRPSTPDLYDTEASKPRYDVEELEALRETCIFGRLRSCVVEQNSQHIFTTSSAVMLRAFSDYQLTLDQPELPEEDPAQCLDSAREQTNDKLVPCGRGAYSGLDPSYVDSVAIAAVDSWTSLPKNHDNQLEFVEKPPVPIIILGLAARASARKGHLQTEVPAKPRSGDIERAKAVVQPPRIGPSRRNKGKTTKPTNNDKLTYKDGEKAPEFLDLPFEVQTTILEYALLQDEHIHVDALFRTLNKKAGEFRRRGYGALFVCHHFHKIGREAYYAINTFTMSLGLWISLAKLMTAWPNIPRYANNIQPALMHMKHIIVSQLGPGEHGSTYGLWRHLIQFLRPFQHLEIVEIDLREPEYGWTGADEKSYKVAPVPENLRLRLQRAGGIRIGWTKKESDMTGIKDGALMCRITKTQTQHWTRLSLAQVMNALP